MSIEEIIIATLIYFIIPFIGVFMYSKLIRKMNFEKIVKPPKIDLFLIFLNYGGLLLIILTSLLWKWSGLASLGAFYLILIAPILMLITAYRNYKNKELSKYHLIIFRLSLLFFTIVPLGIYITTLFE